MSTNPQQIPATYGGLVEVCAAHGIGRSVAFELSRMGLLDVFRIGRRRMVYVDSVRTLPERLAARDAAGRSASK